MCKLLLVFICLFLSSCAYQYIPPEGVPLVEVTYILHSVPRRGGLTNVFIHEQGNCDSISAAGILKNRNGKPEIFILEVPAGDILYNSYRTDSSRGNQNEFRYFASSFTPEYGKKYQIHVFPFSGATVSEVSSSGEQLIESSVPRKDICTF